MGTLLEKLGFRQLVEDTLKVKRQPGPCQRIQSSSESDHAVSPWSRVVHDVASSALIVFKYCSLSIFTLTLSRIMRSQGLRNVFSVRRIAGISLVSLVALYSVFCAALYSAMLQPPERFGGIMTHVPNVAFAILPFESLWMRARTGSLKAGDVAPDFELPTLDRSRTVKLSSEYRSKPVALIFGSYT
jgi:hypothetical protein